MLVRMGACSAKDGGRGQITILHQPKSQGCQFLACVPLIPEYFPCGQDADGQRTYTEAFRALHALYNNDLVRQTFMSTKPKEPIEELFEFYIESVGRARERNPHTCFPLPVAVLGSPAKGAPWEVVGAFICRGFDNDGLLGRVRKAPYDSVSTAAVVGIYRNRESRAMGFQPLVGFNILRTAVMQYRLAFDHVENPLDVPWPAAIDASMVSHNVGCAALLKEMSCYVQEAGVQIGLPVFETQEGPSNVSVNIDTGTDSRHLITCFDSATIARACTATASGFDAAKTRRVSLESDFPGLLALLEIHTDEQCNVVYASSLRNVGAAFYSDVPLIMRLFSIHSQARAEAEKRTKGPVRVAHNPYAFAAVDSGARLAPPAPRRNSEETAPPSNGTAADAAVTSPLREEPELQRFLQLHGLHYPSFGAVMAMMLLMRDVRHAMYGSRLSDETFAIYLCREIVREHRASLGQSLAATRESLFASAVVVASVFSGLSSPAMRLSVVTAASRLFPQSVPFTLS